MLHPHVCPLLECHMLKVKPLTTLPNQYLLIFLLLPRGPQFSSSLTSCSSLPYICTPVVLTSTMTGPSCPGIMYLHSLWGHGNPHREWSLSGTAHCSFLWFAYIPFCCLWGLWAPLGPCHPWTYLTRMLWKTQVFYDCPMRSSKGFSRELEIYLVFLLTLIKTINSYVWSVLFLESNSAQLTRQGIATYISLGLPRNRHQNTIRCARYFLEDRARKARRVFRLQ